MEADPAAFRTKFRKMAADPFAFYRGSACLFYADVARQSDPWADQRTRRVWIQGDLHAQNFGTYLNSAGVLVFDVNDFDEAYLGHFTWDLQRFAASLALLGWSKALSDTDIDAPPSPNLTVRTPRPGHTPATCQDADAPGRSARWWLSSHAPYTPGYRAAEPPRPTASWYKRDATSAD